MKKLAIILSLISLGLFSNKMYAQITLLYSTGSGEIVRLDSVSFYDTESKPTYFNVLLDHKNQDSFIYRVEIFRLISVTERSEIREHFFKSKDFLAEELSKGITLEDMFTSSPHSLIVHGFEIKFCRLEKYKANTPCESLNKFRVLYDE